jgi:MFS family permease
MGESERSLLGTAAVTHPDFTLYQIARFFIVAALEMQSVAVGWQVYEITHRALDLGLVGLAQFLPGVFLFLVAGHAADRHDRRRLLNICYFGFILCSGLLLALAVRGVHSVHLIYLVLLLLGVVRCFNWPASRALLPQIVPPEYSSRRNIHRKRSRGMRARFSRRPSWGRLWAACCMRRPADRGWFMARRL